MNADLGTLTPDGDNWTITFTRRLKHPPERVWRAVTEPEHLAAWFPDKIEGEWRAGAPLRFVTQTGDGFDGEMVTFDPPSVIEMMWGTDRLRIELEPDGAGTVLTLSDTLTELGKAARDGAGWHECLDHLLDELDGRTPTPWGEGWKVINPQYQEKFGPDASTIGPPEGYGSS
jgi:uncharacterized protein YndB with AHSA1/START domain